jgi:Flp pilus assembly protein CpaB
MRSSPSSRTTPPRPRPDGLSQPREQIVRARADIAVLSPIDAAMVELVTVSPAGAPANAARNLEDVVGRYASVPILAGQDVDLRVLEDNPGELAFGFGAPLGPGQVAFALPVDPAQAIGGAVTPGARVDVVAVPNTVRTQLSVADGEEAPGSVVLGEGLVVLAVRTQDGQSMPDVEDTGGDSVSLPPRLGSVVVAIPAARLPEFATAALGATFYVALAGAAGR